MPEPKRGIIDSFNYAIEGFIYVLKTQFNMRIHFLIGVAVLLTGIYFNISKVELMILTTSIALVILAEMFNTAIEFSADLLNQGFHPMIRMIKDISAGAVLLSAVNGLIVGYLIFLNRLDLPLEIGISRIRQSPWHITFIALILVLALVVFGKVIFHRGRPLRGGMPSGHAAVAFSIWIITVFSKVDSLLTFLIFIMAFIIARSRVKTAIHNLWEVVAGAALGILITTMVFQILR